MVQICRKHLLNRKFLQVGRIATGENCASAARMTLESGETSACTANEVIYRFLYAMFPIELCLSNSFS